MNRINVYTYPTDEYDQDGPKLAGWFNADRAERFGEDTEFDGNNHISVNTRSQWRHEELYRTAKGRWVHGKYSNHQGTTPSYEFVDDERAKTWLTINRHDEAVERFFGEVEDERGPGRGRPRIEGDPINVKLGDVQPAVDAYATSRSIDRAVAIRELCSKALDAETRTERQNADDPMAHGNYCTNAYPRFTVDSTGQYGAECDACGFEITGCETRAEAGVAFYATMKIEVSV